MRLLRRYFEGHSWRVTPMAYGQCQAVALLEVGTSSATTHLLPVWDQRLLLAAPTPACWRKS